MFSHEAYVAEKLRSFEDEYLDQRLRRAVVDLDDCRPERIRRTRPVLGPVARLAGQSLRRCGEALEFWAMRPRARDQSAAVKGPSARTDADPSSAGCR